MSHALAAAFAAAHAPETSPYGWIITVDHLYGPTAEDPDESMSDAGTLGPRNLSDTMAAKLQAGEGTEFQMLDADDILYYSGRIILDEDHPESTGEDEYGPLTDFGTPNAGAIDIQYRNANGTWESL